MKLRWLQRILDALCLIGFGAMFVLVFLKPIPALLGGVAIVLVWLAGSRVLHSLTKAQIHLEFASLMQSSGPWDVTK